MLTWEQVLQILTDTGILVEPQKAGWRGTKGSINTLGERVKEQKSKPSSNL